MLYQYTLDVRPAKTLDICSQAKSLPTCKSRNAHRYLVKNLPDSRLSANQGLICVTPTRRKQLRRNRASPGGSAGTNSRYAPWGPPRASRGVKQYSDVQVSVHSPLMSPKKSSKKVRPATKSVWGRREPFPSHVLRGRLRRIFSVSRRPTLGPRTPC